jgi:hypothetical protein
MPIFIALLQFMPRVSVRQLAVGVVRWRLALPLDFLP